MVGAAPSRAKRSFNPRGEMDLTDPLEVGKTGLSVMRDQMADWSNLS